ncbi:MAG: hypothetical protein GKR89_07465 [Candidatus Latescibacteria bacterium]|nr:hypothetical protein [Candidatus Latescibacterota bacterium]
MTDLPVRCPGNHHVLKAGPDKNRITQAQALEIDYHQTPKDSLEQMQTRGFVVFKNLLSPEETAQLRQLMDATGGDDEAHFKRGNYLKKEDETDFRRFDKHTGQPFCQDQAYLDYVDRSPAIDIIEGIHGYGTRLIGGSIWVTGPGRYPMGLHIDYQPFGLPADIAGDPRVQVPIMISTLHYYLNDMYMDLGPTLIVEGSHRSGRAPNGDTGWQGKECKALLCRAGDALLFRSDIWHGALPNMSQERRYMLQVHYGCAYIERPFATPWTRKQALPDEYADTCNDRQRRLLGQKQEGHYVPQGSYVLNSGPNQGDVQWHQK